MVLRIDEAELQAKLFEHKELIGLGPVSNGIVNIVAGIFYIPTALTSFSDFWLRTLFTLVGLFFLIFGIVTTIYAATRRYDAKQLYEDITAMDRTERRSSIIALKNTGEEFPNRFLVYLDKGWNCVFFPNHKTIEPASENARQLRQYLSSEFGVPEKDIDLEYVRNDESKKASTEHDGEIRYYIYSLYKATLKHIPASWQADQFQVGAKECRWMSLDDMLADPRINQINHDVIALVRDYAS